MKLNHLWATDIAEFTLKDVSVLDSLIRDMQTPRELNKDNTRNNFLKEETLFTSWVIECCKQYTSLFDQPEYNQIFKNHKIDRAWTNHQRYGEELALHSHAPTAIAGAFYLEADALIHPPIEFVDPRPPHMFNSVFRMRKDGLGIQGGFRTTLFNPEKNKLILFPGYLLHQVGVNFSTIDRVAVSFNISVNR